MQQLSLLSALSDFSLPQALPGRHCDWLILELKEQAEGLGSGRVVGEFDCTAGGLFSAGPPVLSGLLHGGPEGGCLASLCPIVGTVPGHGCQPFIWMASELDTENSCLLRQRSLLTGAHSDSLVWELG